MVAASPQFSVLISQSLSLCYSRNRSLTASASFSARPRAKAPNLMPNMATGSCLGHLLAQALWASSRLQLWLLSPSPSLSYPYPYPSLRLLLGQVPCGHPAELANWLTVFGCLPVEQVSSLFMLCFTFLFFVLRNLFLSFSNLIF